MTEQTEPKHGTLAEETARLIEAMASMARSSVDPSQDTSAYDGVPAWGAGSSGEPRAALPDDDPKPAPSAGGCSSCGGERDGTPVACRLCPLCQLIALLRSVRPETVDRLADLASAAAESLRDMATQSRASGPASSARPGSTAGPAASGDRPASGSSSERAHAKVQNICVEDESEG